MVITSYLWVLDHTLNNSCECINLSFVFMNSCCFCSSMLMDASMMQIAVSLSVWCLSNYSTLAIGTIGMGGSNRSGVSRTYTPFILENNSQVTSLSKMLGPLKFQLSRIARKLKLLILQWTKINIAIYVNKIMKMT